MSVRRHYVLKVDGDPFDVFELALEDLEEAEGLGLELGDVGSSDGVITTYDFYDVDAEVRIQLADDSETPARYVIVEARDDEAAGRIGAALGKSLPIWSAEELCDAAEHNLDDDPGTLIRLALGVGTDPAPEAMAILEQGLHHQDREVRLSAVEATSLTQWPDAESRLISVRDNDPDGDVREYAERAIDALRRALE